MKKFGHEVLYPKCSADVINSSNKRPPVDPGTVPAWLAMLLKTCYFPWVYILWYDIDPIKVYLHKYSDIISSQ